MIRSKMADYKTSPWFSTLFLLTCVHTFSFITVTIVQFSNLNQIDGLDTALKNGLQNLYSRFDEDPNINSRVKRASTFISDLLSAQAQVLEQHCLDHNKTCPNGAPGSRGVEGPQGDQGPKGDRGPPGPMGQSGKAGPKGDPGSLGAKGMKGDPGLQGDNGQRGLQGAKGQKGQRGDKGQRGIEGSSGPKGSAGLPGSKGNYGDTGDTGSKGSKGTIGLQGPAGTKGAPGVQGSAGTDTRMLSDGCSCIRTIPPTVPSV